MQNDYDENPDKSLLFVDFGTNMMKRIYLNSIVRKVVVRLTSEQLANFASFLPAPSNQLLVKVIVTADVSEIPSLVKSPAFLACERIVDKIVFEKTNRSASIASQMITESGVNKEEVTLETIIKSMLKDDKETADLFDSLIA
jgi:hypothetical protein